MRKVPLFKTYMGQEEVEAVKEVLLSGWVTLGPKTVEFENAYAKFIGSKYGIGTNSGTAALHLGLAIFDFPEGSEVLMPTINFISAPHAAYYNKLKPVFVDVDPKTLCIDVVDLEKKITPKSKAIIATHLGGIPVNMDAIMKIAEKYSLKVIEDVANAVGGSYDGKMLGSIGHVGCHSFEGKKNMTTGDGGMITLNDDELNDRLRRMRWLGINKDTWKRFSEKQGSYSWYYEVSDIGYKYNMNDIMAAIGLVQLGRLPGLLQIKNKLVEKYNKELSTLAWVETPTIEPKGVVAPWLYIIKVPDRDGLMKYLEDNGVTTGVHFMPMHLHPLYKQEANTPVADKIWHNIVSLPLYPGMTDEDQDYVINLIKKYA
ncbi:MAG: DegT/DnrJ/EryC1/StrS aminotransferase family protein [Candidatus Vogelbacteria bacterium]|nr:DegT/DnrJ/EryC1/StrS aminotransferase family protein [Candidatus Vogelbacteria bacterium]